MILFWGRKKGGSDEWAPEEKPPVQSTQSVEAVADDAPEAEDQAVEEAFHISWQPSGDDEIDHTKKRLREITQQYNQTRVALQVELFTQERDYEEQLQSLNMQIKTNQGHIDELSEQLKELEKKTGQDLVDQFDRLHQLHTDAQTSEKKAQEHVDALSKQTDELKKKQLSLKEQSADLTHMLKQIADDLHAESDPSKILKLAEKNRSKISAIETKQSTLQSDQEDVKAQATKLEAELATAQKELKEKTAKVKDLADKGKKLRDQIDAEGHKHDRQMKQVSDQRKTAQNAIKDGEKNKTRLEKQLEEHRKQLVKWLGSTEQLMPMTLTDADEIVLVLDSFLPKDTQILADLARLLISRGLTRLHVYTSLFDINIASEIQEWVRQLGLNEDQVLIENPLFALQQSENQVKNPIKLPEDVHREQWDNAHEVRTLELADDYVLRVTYRDKHAQDVSMIAYYMDQRLTKQTHFNRAGQVGANVYFDDQKQISREEYYRTNGTIALTTHYQLGKLRSVELMDDAGVLVSSFANLADLNRWWIKRNLPSGAGFVGRVEDRRYVDLVKNAGLTAIPFVNKLTTDGELAAFDRQIQSDRYIVSDYRQQQMVTKTLKRNLSLLMLDDTFMPIALATPGE
jgi:predicted  nucleic acid-binding Zn-ribbon protein